MKNITKLTASVVLTAAAFASMPANAVTVSFGGATPTDNSFLTSARTGDLDNVLNPATGFFIETFDYATRNPAFPGSSTQAANPGPNISIANDGFSAINSWGALTLGGTDLSAFTATGGGFSVQRGNTPNVAANPAGDTTSFGFGPQPGQSTTATARIDYKNLLATLPSGLAITYLGLYYGSIDTYNDIAIYDKNGNAVIGAGILSDGVLSGTEVLAAMGGTSGNQTGAGSNVYVNFDFAPGEAFTAFEFRTKGVAFELDNLVVQFTQVPEPASLALIGLGLFGVGAMRRRKEAK